MKPSSIKRDRKPTARKFTPKPQARKSTRSRKPVGEFNQLPNDENGFVSLILQRVGWDQLNELKERRSPRGRPAHVLSRGQLLLAILFHYTVSCAGTLGEHLMMLMNIKMAESSLSQRRQALPKKVFEDLLGLILRPLAKTTSAAFYKDLRLVAIDGVTYSMGHHPSVKERLKKAKNQRGEGGFAKLRCAVLLELLMHNPLAARIGSEGQSEWKLALGLLGQLPAKSLLLADRLYGCGAFVQAALKVLRQRGGHLLVRIKNNIKVVRPLQSLSDGSRLVEIKALDPADYHQVVGTTVVREIQARIQRKGHRTVNLRLWTSLLDEHKYPAEELVRLYMSRWEQELYFRELKHELGTNDLLRSQTVETAAQEVAAMIIGSSIIAAERSKLKSGEQLQHRISFIKVWDLLEPLWLTLLLGADILTSPQKKQLADRFYQMASKFLMPKKRVRSCPRALRQPQQPWPRKTDQKESHAPVCYRILPA